MTRESERTPFRMYRENDALDYSTGKISWIELEAKLRQRAGITEAEITDITLEFAKKEVLKNWEIQKDGKP